MPDSHVNLSAGLPETVLPPPPADAAAALAAALAGPADDRRSAIGAVATRWPRFLDAWAALADQATDHIESYAYARVGYHRGLDTARAAGWRGSGYIRWRVETNRGFLGSLEALRRAAAAIGEDDEAARCEQFLHQLDPEWGKLPR